MIHGGLTQDERLENMRDFKKGMFRFLIASDVAARGIDIANISHIYNYDCPTTAEGFIHRIGRSGRVDNKGEAYTLVLPTQMKYLDLIQDEMDCRFIEVEDIEDGVDKLIDMVNRMNEKLGIPKSFQEYGIDEETYMSKIDELANRAFEDQCTTSNPRLPLVTELKKILVDAYYGINL